MNKLTKSLLLMTIIATTTPVMGQNANPLLQEWKTPHQTPPFSQIRNEHYTPAVKEAIKEADFAVKRLKSLGIGPKDLALPVYMDYDLEFFAFCNCCLAICLKKGDIYSTKY